MSVTFAIDLMANVLDELEPLHRAHWDECAHLRPPGDYNPQYDRFLALERQGCTVLAVARRDGRIIGFCSHFLNVCLWTGRRYASGDRFYVVPEERDGWMIVALMRYALGALEYIGITEVRGFSTDDNKISKVMRRLNYRDTGSRLYVRQL